MKGAERIELFAELTKRKLKDIKRAVGMISEDTYNATFNAICNKDEKLSTEDINKKVEKFAAGMQKKRKITKAEENPNGMHISPEMDGSIVLSCILKGEGHEEHVDAEITKRDIDLPKELKDMTWNEKKDQLRIDEMQVKVAKDLAFSIEHWSKVTAIEPQSVNQELRFRFLKTEEHCHTLVRLQRIGGQVTHTQVLVNTSSNCFGMLTNRVDTSMLDTANGADVNASVGVG